MIRTQVSDVSIPPNNIISDVVTWFSIAWWKNAESSVKFINAPINE